VDRQTATTLPSKPTDHHQQPITLLQPQPDPRSDPKPNLTETPTAPNTPEPQPHAPDLRENLLQELRTCSVALRRIGQAQVRRRRHEAMTDYRDWRQLRRQRTRLLIEYGGLIVKAGLPDRLEDDRATCLGGLLWLREQLDGHGDDSPADLKLRWRRKGLRAFDQDAALKKPGKREDETTQHRK